MNTCRQLTPLLLLVPFFAHQPAAAQAVPEAPKPPVAKKLPHDRTVHGDTFTDNYFWLREKGSPAVTAHLEAENAYTAAVMKASEPLQEALYKEMLGRIKQTDLSVPYDLNGYRYYSRTEQGKQYPIFCRKKGGDDAPEAVLLDGNAMAKGHPFFSVGQQQVSDDSRLLAHATDTTGFREYHLLVKDLTTGVELPDRVGKVSNYAWAADNKTLFYVTEDAAKRPHRLYRHALGATTPDELLYEEKDELYRLSVNRSRDKKYLFASCVSSTTSEMRYLPSDRPGGQWTTILPRENDHLYDADHRDGSFYIHTNKGAKNYRVVTAPVADPSPANWKELVAHRAVVLLGRPVLFETFLVVPETEAAVQHLRVFGPAAGASHRVEFPEPVYAAFPEVNPEFRSPTVRFTYQSMVTPNSVYDYDPATRQRKLLKQTEVPGGFDPANYVSERVWATAGDGVKVPISLVRRKGVTRDGTAPLLLNGYGAYGASASAGFSAQRLALLDRGVVYAEAHIRGGKDLGQNWHDQGKMLNKRNTFTDFIACADHLVAERYTARDRLAIQGGSAGGLLIGAVLNLRPDVCRAAVLRVPFVDVIGTMLDESLPLTVQEFLEWGNPKLREQYDYMKAYCPYTNLAAKDYPAILVTTSLNDSQVMYWEPAKYVARLRSLKTDRNPLVFKCQMAGGHGGPSGRYDSLKEQAFVYAFVLGQIAGGH